MTPAFNGMLFDRSLICASCGAAVAAVIVAALALVVGRFVRRRPAPLRYGLLLAALVVLGIVPAVAAASRLGGWGAVRISPVAVDRPLAPQPFLVTPAVPRPMPMPAIADGEEALRPDRIAEPTVMPMRVPTLREAASGLLWAWLGGLLFFVGMVIRDLVRLRRLRLTLVPCTSPAAVGLLNDAARSVGLTQPPRLFESAAVPVPVVIGPVKPVVVLPAGMANTLDHEKLTAVLLHEAAHVVHGDLWVGLLQHAVAAIFWWCPPVHRLNRRLAEVREEICDDYVVLAQGDGFQLAEVLVEMAAGLRGSRQRLTIGTLGAIDEKPALEGRVERLIDLTRKALPMTRMSRLAVVATGAFSLVALAIVLATTIHAADEPPAAETKASPAAPPLAAVEAKEPPAAPLNESTLQAEWRNLDDEQAGAVILRNMRGLVRAMHKYEEAHGSLPPAVVLNPNLPPEKRLSGFVLLLPFLDATDFPKKGQEGARFFDNELSAMAKTVGETIDVTKAWDDPANLQAARTVIPALLAPGSGPFRDKNGYAVSHFAFVRGANGKDDGVFNETVGITFGNAEKVIEDGSSCTFALGQINDELGPWTAAGFSTSRHAYHPSDTFTAPTFGSQYVGGCYFVNCDSYAYFLDIDKTGARNFHALATRAGWESLDSSALPRFNTATEWKRSR